MAEALTAARRRRGTVRASITKFEARINKWEDKVELSAIDHRSIQRGIETLKEYDDDFRKNHFSVVELVNEEDLDAEQDVLDEHTDRVTEFSDRLLQMLPVPEKVSEKTSSTTVAEALLKRLRYVIMELTSLNDTVDLLTPGPGMDTCLLRQLRRQVNSMDSELVEITHKILSLDSEEEAMMDERSKVKSVLLQVDLKIERLLQDVENSPKISKAEAPGIRLPKISVPTFDGNILNWTSFWEQFEVAVHSKGNLRDVEKLAYLKDAVKNSPAKHVIEGLSRTAGSYAEAISCLRERYDRPRLIHQAHVRAILEAPSLRNGSGPELRHLHDVVKQHMRALEAMKGDSLVTFVSSLIELKLDRSSMFAWQNHSKDQREVPSYTDLLEFIDLRARASENIAREGDWKRDSSRKSAVKSYVADVQDSCVACKAKHPLHKCRDFCAMSHDRKMAIVKKNALCINCLRPGHFLKNCPTEQRCKECRKPHHSLMHIAPPKREEETRSAKKPPKEDTTVISTHVSQLQNCRQVLLMTCRIKIVGPDGSTTQARALLDSASSTSFITERLAQRLRLVRRSHSVKISGIGATSHQPSSRGVTNFSITRPDDKGKLVPVEALILSKITSTLPLRPVSWDSKWKHLDGLQLADPDFGIPGNVDLLLGADIFSRVVLHGRRFGPSGSPSAFKTWFGWVLAGAVHIGQHTSQSSANQCYISTITEENLRIDNALRRFWEIEDHNVNQPALSIDERIVIDHFVKTHRRDEQGRFIVPLPMKLERTPLGESRSLAVKRFLSLERALRSKDEFEQFAHVMQEYFAMGHVEPVEDLNKSCQDVYYLPMHVVKSETSSTSKIRIVFDASAKSMSGASLNDQLLVGPTVHSSLIDVLIRFRVHKVALTADVSRMYRAVFLPEDQRDLHRFVWREDPRHPFKDLRMTRLTFGVSASSFAANMAVKQNALDHQEEYPQAAKAVLDSFYVDDGLTGAKSIEDAVELQSQLRKLFDAGGFVLRKWKSSEPEVTKHIPHQLLDDRTTQRIRCEDSFTKVLGIEWDSESDSFRPLLSTFAQIQSLTKRALISDIARLFDVLGWCAPAMIKPKILLQRLWEERLDWDAPAPQAIQDVWERWRSEIPELRKHMISRCYFPKEANIITVQLHGFSDASESAYAGAVYLKGIDDKGRTHVSLVMAKTKVAPIKRLTIPRLELCGAVVLAKLISHIGRILEIPANQTYAWTDSLVVLSWLKGDPRRFKTFVGNRVSEIIDLTPPTCWHYVKSASNPADCASRGLFPGELAEHSLWWNGPDWLKGPKAGWPSSPTLAHQPEPSEEREKSAETSLVVQIELPLIERVSSYTKLRRIIAWVLRFARNCRRPNEHIKGKVLMAMELQDADNLLYKHVQSSSYGKEIAVLEKGQNLPRTSKLLPFHPFLDDNGLLRVGGRLAKAELKFSERHPILLPGNHAVVKLLISSEHLRLLHAGPTLVAGSLSRNYCIMGGRRVIRSVVRSCVKCKRVHSRPTPQIHGQLPSDRLNPGTIFNCVGVDYAGPIWTKSGHLRKPTINKTYVAVFVCLSVKAVHLEAVTELTTAAFIATLRRFIARRGTPATIWSDNGTNFVGAASEIDKMIQDPTVSNYCASRSIQWKFIPEHAPHFGGLWEAAVKSFKKHLKVVVGETKLTFEELTTFLTQIEACLNSRPLTPLPEASDGIDALTPGHFLIGRPISSLPDQADSYRPISLLRRWHLCQMLTRHFWQRWSSEYLTTLQKFSKWHIPSRDLQVNDVVCLRDEPSAPTKWPLARITEIHPGYDGKVRVVTVRTEKGTYKRPVIKIVPLVCQEDGSTN